MVGPRYSLQFVPEVIGNYMINILYGCDPVPGSPFTCSTFDPNFVRILEVTPGGNIGQNINFSGKFNQTVTQASLEFYLFSYFYIGQNFYHYSFRKTV